MKAPKNNAVRVWLCLLVVLTMVGGIQLNAQHADSTSTVICSVTNAETSDAISGASVGVLGTRKGGYADKDGRARIGKLKPGRYTLKVSSIGFDVDSSTTVICEAGSTVRVAVALIPSNKNLDEVVVVADNVNDNAAAQLAERKNASGISDGLTSQHISRQTDSDAGQAVSRVTAVTLVNDKHVYIRGLSDRYNNTTLNGAPMSSSSSDRRSFSYDVLPSYMLQNITVVKSFTPDLPGDFVGGMVQLNTVDFPSGFKVNVGGSAAYNDQITFTRNAFLSTPAGPMDWLGMGGSWRSSPAMPSVEEFASLRSRAHAGDEAAIAAHNALGRGFNNTLLAPERYAAPANTSLNIGLMNIYPLGGESNLGVTAALKHGVKYDANTMIRRGVQSDGQSLLYDYTGTVTTRHTALSAFANVVLAVDEQNKLSLKNTYSSTSADEAVYQFGHDVTKSQLRKNLSFEYNQNSLLALVLSGDHDDLASTNASLDWTLSYSLAQNSQPDFRRLRFSKSEFADANAPLEVEIPNSGFTTQGLGSAAGRFFSDLSEHFWVGKFNLRLPDDLKNVKVGALISDKQRQFSSRSFTYVQSANSTLDYHLLTYSPLPHEVPDVTQLFADSNFRSDGLGLSEDSRLRDSYSASESLYSAYGMADLPFTLFGIASRVVGGARIEHSVNTLASYNDSDVPVDVNLSITDVLPSINIVLTPWENVNVRLGATRTLSRPAFREFAPFTFFDFQTQGSVRGNPEITRTIVQNFDSRLEWFIGADEVVSASAFYKKLDHALESTIEPASSELIRSYRNSSEPATIYGVEFEVQKNLGFVAGFLKHFSINANAAFMHSSVKVMQGVLEDTRAMWGQSPYTLNGALTYSNLETETAITLSYNRSGRRIIQVAPIGVYEVGQAFLEDGPHVYENPRDMVDLSIMQQFGDWKVKLALRDLLNQQLTWEQLGTTVAVNQYGREISLQFSYTFTSDDDERDN